MSEAPHFSRFIDLAAERFGGKTLEANDEFFAEKENLLKPGRGVFIEDKYTDHGKWMDGWETRRRRDPGNDWCVIRLGQAGEIHGVNIDTNHFLGNHPDEAFVEACFVGEGESLGDATWETIVPKGKLKPGSENFFECQTRERFNHVRLTICPDGGVARFRVYGRALPNWKDLAKASIDLIAAENGGLALRCSDMFFSHMNNLLMPGRSSNMGDGWETKRRRGPGHDWVIIQLGHRGTVHRIEVDTNHFKGNYPSHCEIEACLSDGENFSWKPLLPKSELKAHHQHLFESEVQSVGSVSHVRMNIYPDGGISRLRLFGEIDSDE